MLHDLRGKPPVQGLHFTWKSFSILSAAIMLLPAGSLVRAGLPEAVGRGWIILVSKSTSLVLIFALVLCMYTLLSWLGENRLRKRELDAGMDRRRLEEKVI
jgi:hypothetical protein